MEQETEKKETKVLDKLKEETDKSMKRVLEQGVQTNNVDFLYKMIDIKKDIAEIEKEEQEMMYGNYGRYDDMSYSGGRRRDSRGRYMEGGSYGRRGVPGSGRGRYRGEEAIDEMYMNYQDYNEANNEYGRGNYGAEGGMKESAEGIMENIYEIVEELKDTGSPEVMQVIKKYSKKISEM